MKVLVAPLNYSHRQRGQIEAFQTVFGQDNVREVDWLGLHRRGFDGGEQVFAEAQRFSPDWIWLQVQGAEEFGVYWIDRIKERLPRCFITHWMGDCRPTIAPKLAALCRVTHATLISSVGQIPLYQEAFAGRTAYVQIGLDPEDLGGYFNANDETVVPHVSDIVFCGGCYEHVPEFKDGTRERLNAIRRLKAEGFDIGVVGSGWPSDVPVIGQCHVKQSHYVYKRAKIVLAVNHFNDIERYYSDRLLIAMASSTPVAARYVPGLEEEFRHREHCWMWSTMDELVEGVTTMLKDAHGRSVMGQQAWEHVVKHHTWEARIRQLAPKIEAWRREDLL